MSLCLRKPIIRDSDQSDTNRSAQSRKQARSLKFLVYVEKKLYYPCSENKGADQLRSFCEADLYLCFRLCRLLVVTCGGSYVKIPLNYFGFGSAASHASNDAM